MNAKIVRWAVVLSAALPVGFGALAADPPKETKDAKAALGSAAAGAAKQPIEVILSVTVDGGIVRTSPNPEAEPQRPLLKGLRERERREKILAEDFGRLRSWLTAEKSAGRGPYHLAAQPTPVVPAGDLAEVLAYLGRLGADEGVDGVSVRLAHGVVLRSEKSPADVGPPGFAEKPAPKRLVFVVDRSGSMDPVGDFLKTELAKAVNRLLPDDAFNVIWFSEGDPYVLATNLVHATEENKGRLFKFLQDVKLQGSSDPRSAMFKALDLRPDEIHFLTDGNFEPEFVEQITKRNAGKIRINALGFVLPGNEGLSREGHSNLKKLTEQNGGKLKTIDIKDLTGK
jgi:hypothetical protein